MGQELSQSMSKRRCGSECMRWNPGWEPGAGSETSLGDHGSLFISDRCLLLCHYLPSEFVPRPCLDFWTVCFAFSSTDAGRTCVRLLTVGYRLCSSWMSPPGSGDLCVQTVALVAERSPSASWRWCTAALRVLWTRAWTLFVFWQNRPQAFNVLK